LKKLGNILQQYFHDLGIEKTIKRHQAVSIWPDVVGEKISKVTNPVRVSKDTLFVKVINDAWRNEIHYYKTEIIQKLNQSLGSQMINDIVFI
jgi:hypothetical protein